MSHQGGEEKDHHYEAPRKKDWATDDSSQLPPAPQGRLFSSSRPGASAQGPEQRQHGRGREEFLPPERVAQVPLQPPPDQHEEGKNDSYNSDPRRNSSPRVTTTHSSNNMIVNYEQFPTLLSTSSSDENGERVGDLYHYTTGTTLSPRNTPGGQRAGGREKAEQRRSDRDEVFSDRPPATSTNYESTSTTRNNSSTATNRTKGRTTTGTPPPPSYKFEKSTTSTGQKSRTSSGLSLNRKNEEWKASVSTGVLGSNQARAAPPPAILDERVLEPVVQQLSPPTLITTNSSFHISQGSFLVQEFLGRGGSAEVFRATRGKREFALKAVSAQDKRQYNAYVKEIEILEKLNAKKLDCIIQSYGANYEPENLKMFLLLELADCDFAKYQKRFLKYTKTKKGSKTMMKNSEVGRKSSNTKTSPSTPLEEVDNFTSEKTERTIEALYHSMNIPDGGMSLPLLLHCWTQMVDAVAFIHSVQVAHFDLKPANFLVFHSNVEADYVQQPLVDDQGGSPTFENHMKRSYFHVKIKLSDFGLAKQFAEEKSYVTRQNHAGTLLYMAPECFYQPENLENADQLLKMRPAADCWALGIILYQLIHLRTPFEHLMRLSSKAGGAAGGGYNRVMFAVIDPDLVIQFPQVKRFPIEEVERVLDEEHKRPTLSSSGQAGLLSKSNSKKNSDKQEEDFYPATIIENEQHLEFQSTASTLIPPSKNVGTTSGIGAEVDHASSSRSRGSQRDSAAKTAPGGREKQSYTSPPSKLIQFSSHVEPLEVLEKMSRTNNRKTSKDDDADDLLREHKNFVAPDAVADGPARGRSDHTTPTAQSKADTTTTVYLPEESQLQFEHLNGILQHCLVKDPKKRISAEEIKTALEEMSGSDFSWKTCRKAKIRPEVVEKIFVREEESTEQEDGEGQDQDGRDPESARGPREKIKSRFLVPNLSTLKAVHDQRQNPQGLAMAQMLLLQQQQLQNADAGDEQDLIQEQELVLQPDDEAKRSDDFLKRLADYDNSQYHDLQTDRVLKDHSDEEGHATATSALAKNWKVWTVGAVVVSVIVVALTITLVLVFSVPKEQKNDEKKETSSTTHEEEQTLLHPGGGTAAGGGGSMQQEPAPALGGPASAPGGAPAPGQPLGGTTGGAGPGGARGGIPSRRIVPDVELLIGPQRGDGGARPAPDGGANDPGSSSSTTPPSGSPPQQAPQIIAPPKPKAIPPTVRAKIPAKWVPPSGKTQGERPAPMRSGESQRLTEELKKELRWNRFRGDEVLVASLLAERYDLSEFGIEGPTLPEVFQTQTPSPGSAQAGAPAGRASFLSTGLQDELAEEKVHHAKVNGDDGVHDEDHVLPDRSSRRGAAIQSDMSFLQMQLTINRRSILTPASTPPVRSPPAHDNENLQHADGSTAPPAVPAAQNNQLLPTALKNLTLQHHFLENIRDDKIHLSYARLKPRPPFPKEIVYGPYVESVENPRLLYDAAGNLQPGGFSQNSVRDYLQMRMLTNFSTFTSTTTSADETINMSNDYLTSDFLDETVRPAMWRVHRGFGGDVSKRWTMKKQWVSANPNWSVKELLAWKFRTAKMFEDLLQVRVHPWDLDAFFLFFDLDLERMSSIEPEFQRTYTFTEEKARAMLDTMFWTLLLRRIALGNAIAETSTSDLDHDAELMSLELTTSLRFFPRTALAHPKVVYYYTRDAQRIHDAIFFDTALTSQQLPTLPAEAYHGANFEGPGLYTTHMQAGLFGNRFVDENSAVVEDKYNEVQNAALEHSYEELELSYDEQMRAFLKTVFESQVHQENAPGTDGKNSSDLLHGGAVFRAYSESVTLSDFRFRTFPIARTEIGTEYRESNGDRCVVALNTDSLASRGFYLDRFVEDLPVGKGGYPAAHLPLRQVFPSRDFWKAGPRGRFWLPNRMVMRRLLGTTATAERPPGPVFNGWERDAKRERLIKNFAVGKRARLSAAWPKAVRTSDLGHVLKTGRDSQVAQEVERGQEAAGEEEASGDRVTDVCMLVTSDFTIRKEGGDLNDKEQYWWGNVAAAHGAPDALTCRERNKPPLQEYRRERRGTNLVKLLEYEDGALPPQGFAEPSRDYILAQQAVSLQLTELPLVDNFIDQEEVEGEVQGVTAQEAQAESGVQGVAQETQDDSAADRRTSRTSTGAGTTSSNNVGHLEDWLQNFLSKPAPSTILLSTTSGTPNPFADPEWIRSAMFLPDSTTQDSTASTVAAGASSQSESHQSRTSRRSPVELAMDALRTASERSFISSFAGGGSTASTSGTAGTSGTGPQIQPESTTTTPSGDHVPHSAEDGTFLRGPGNHYRINRKEWYLDKRRRPLSSMATIFSNVESTQRMAFRRHNFDLPADSSRSTLFNSTAYESSVENRAPNPFRDNSAQLGTSSAATPAIHQQLQRGERDFLKLFNTESEEEDATHRLREFDDYYVVCDLHKTEQLRKLNEWVAIMEGRGFEDLPT